MPMTPLATPPSRSDPNNFAERGDVLMTALPGFVTEANALEANVDAKEASAVLAAGTASGAAVTAVAAANAAASSIAAPVWVSGTVYPLLAKVVSPANKLIYTRSVAGAGATDPSADAVNWAPLIVPLAAGGTGATTAANARTALGIGSVTDASFAAKANSTAPLFTGTAAELATARESLGIGTTTGRNRIINGGCQISQESAVASILNAGVFGGVDRYQMIFVGNGAGTQSQSTITFNGVAESAVRITCTAVATPTGSNYVGGIVQNMEGFTVSDLRGKKVAASCVFNSNVSGQFSATLRDAGGSAVYVKKFTLVANVPQKVELVTSTALPLSASIPNTAGVGLTWQIGALNTGTYQTATTDAWVTLPGGLSATGNVNWCASINNFIEATRIQVEESVVTDFERKKIGEEWLTCKRYFQSVDTLRSIYTTAGTVMSQHWNYPVPMRATPTAVPSASYANTTNYNISAIGPYSFVDNITIVSTGSGLVNGTVKLQAYL